MESRAMTTYKLEARLVGWRLDDDCIPFRDTMTFYFDVPRTLIDNLYGSVIQQDFLDEYATTQQLEEIADFINGCEAHAWEY